MEEKERMEVLNLGMKIGRAEMANANEKFNKIARLKTLKEIQDQGLHKCMPECKNLSEVFKKIGVSKTTGYEELKTLDLLGEQAVELLIDLGITSRDSYMLAKSLGAGEDAEFAVLDKESGEFRVAGLVVTMDADRGLISDALFAAVQRVNLESGARENSEEKLKETAVENKALREKIRNGEERLSRLEQDAKRRERGLLEESKGEFGNLVMNLLALIKTMSETELTEEEQKLAERYLDLIEGKALNAIYEKLRVYLPKQEWE